MKRFILDSSNDRISVVHSSAARNKARGRHFATEQEWIRIGSDIPSTGLIAIWNNLPEVAAVARFTSRDKALKRIWKALETLELQSGNNAPEQTVEADVKPDNSVTADSDAGRTADSGESKKQQIIALLRSAEGVSIDQLVRHSGWQKHSIRGFLSAVLRKKLGLTLVSSRNAQGARVYRIGG